MPPGGRIISLADCYLNSGRGGREEARFLAGLQDYRKMLDAEKLDAVIVATGDRRVIPWIHACQAGKDVYAEKPLTLHPAKAGASQSAGPQTPDASFRSAASSGPWN